MQLIDIFTEFLVAGQSPHENAMLFYNERAEYGYGSSKERVTKVDIAAGRSVKRTELERLVVLKKDISTKLNALSIYDKEFQKKVYGWRKEVHGWRDVNILSNK